MKFLYRAALASALIAGGVALAVAQQPAQPTHRTQQPAQPTQQAAQAAQQPAPAQAPGGNPGKLSAADQKFIETAAMGGRYEIEAGRLAEKSTNRQVKQFGALMVRDHGTADAKLKQIVTAEGGKLSPQLDQEHQQKLNQLRSLHGREFAQAYMQEMVKDHDEDAQEFSKAAQNLDDPQLKAFAQQTLQVIGTHDKLAHQITDKMASK